MACGLSKSRLLAFRQCPKRLWLQVHRPELREVSGETVMAFGHGHTVGAVAQALQPDGILIETDNLSEALAATRRVMTEQPDRAIFEATFEHDGLLIRSDVMTPEPGGYRMTEVKASTRVKDYHLIDCAIQTWVCQQAGIPITRTELAHVDTGFVYPGGGDYRGLFHPVDVSIDIEPILTEVPVWVADAQRLLAGDEPLLETGPHCHAPFDCPFLGYCTRDQALAVSVKYPVASLPHGGQRIANLLAEGYVDVRDVPPERLTSPRHQRIQRVALSETAELDPVVGETLRQLSYPRYYLDFESIQFAVPIWADTRPYQQLVFQWSCHIEREPGKLEHAEYLGEFGQDPRRAFAERLIATLGEHGPVFVYNQGFEGGCLRQLAEAFPDLATPLLAIRERLLDLLPLARNHYYHPDMQGSWSIKAVLPTVAPDLAYENLPIQHGGIAQQAYLQLIEPGITPERRNELRQGLLAYCGLDTLALVRLAWYFDGRPPVSPY